MQIEENQITTVRLEDKNQFLHLYGKKCFMKYLFGADSVARSVKYFKTGRKEMNGQESNWRMLHSALNATFQLKI